MIEVLKVIDETFEGVFEEIPSYNTVEDWVKKIGLDVYNTSGELLENKGYADVIDDSMMIGNEKLLVTLAVPAKHLGHPLCHDEVSVLDMSVSTGWTGESVKAQLEKSAKKVGHQPEYVISDNASIMNKGIRLLGVNHHHDISHSLGMYLKRTYEQANDFQMYVKNMADVKFKYNMTKVAYLLPPTQRTVARFINLSNWVKWSHKMLNVYQTFSSEEKSIFSFIPANTSLIDELSKVMHWVESIESICKHQGFSKDTFLQCKSQIEKHLTTGNCRMIKFGCDILNFLTMEASLLDSNETVHNNSSDIIESVFGTYKMRKSPNKLYGVTPFVLFIPAQTQLLKSKGGKSYLIKERLERTKLKHIDDWVTENLSPNLVSIRTKKLMKTG